MQIRIKKCNGLPKSLRTLVRNPFLPVWAWVDCVIIDVDFNPSLAARKERKERMAKNERQHQQNLARAESESGSTSKNGVALQSQRKRDIDRTLATTRASTASLGRFDRKLEGEKPLKGVKRKVRLRNLIATASLLICVVRPRGGLSR